MKKVYICARLRSDSNEEFDKNIKQYKRYCKFIALMGNLPIAPYLYYSQFLGKTVREIEIGNEINLELLNECDEVWVFVNDMHLSEGMQKEIKFANDNCMFIKYFNDLEIEDQNEQ